MQTHAAAEIGVFVGDGLGLAAGGFGAVGRGAGGQGLLDAVEGPIEVAGGGAGGVEGGGFDPHFRREIEGGGVAERGEIHAPGRGASDQAGSAQMHAADGVAHLFGSAQVHERKPVRQEGLVDDADATGTFQPDGAVMFAVDVHGHGFRLKPASRQVGAGWNRR